MILIQKVAALSKSYHNLYVLFEIDIALDAISLEKVTNFVRSTVVEIIMGIYPTRCTEPKIHSPYEDTSYFENLQINILEYRC